MEDEIKIANCGCGGKGKVLKITEKDYFITCSNCHTDSGIYSTETEAIKAWNKAMGATDMNVGDKFAKDTNVLDKVWTAKVEYIAEVYRGEIVDHYLSGICGICGESTYDRAKYCSECGAKLDWSENE